MKRFFIAVKPLCDKGFQVGGGRLNVNKAAFFAVIVLVIFCSSIGVCCAEDISGVVKEYNNDNVPLPSKNYEVININGGIIQNNENISGIDNTVFSDNNVSLNINRPSQTLGQYFLQGGILNNSAQIGDIVNLAVTNNLIRASADNSGYAGISGGIIYNTGSIGDIVDADFSNNTINVSAENGEAHIRGGLIMNTGTMG